MLWISEEGFSSRMNVCNISSFVTLTLCVVVGFLHGIDALNWGMAPSLLLWTHSIPLFYFELSGIALRFDPFVLFRVLHHRPQIRSLHFVLSSSASRSDSIPSFYFGFSCIVPGFDPFILFQVLRHRAWIRSIRFISGSLASRPDSIPSVVSGFLESH